MKLTKPLRDIREFAHERAGIGDVTGSRWDQLARTAVSVLLVVRVVSVPIVPVVSNDSIGYLDRASAPLATGLVDQGWRQFGYPLFLDVAGDLGSLIGWDRLFAMAAVQRLVFALGIWLVWRTLRWWALPALLFVGSETIVGVTSLLITEGLIVGVATVFGACLVAAIRSRDSRATGRWHAASLVSLLVLVSLKLQFAALILPYLLITLVVYRGVARAVTLALPVAFSAVLIVGMSFENANEVGRFEPVSERARASWYGAYQAVFTVHPANAEDPELARYYDDGDLYEFLHDLERREPEYSVRREVLNQRIHDMFDAAEMSPAAERLQSFIGAIGIGRTDDIKGLVDLVRHADPGSAETTLSRNSFARSHGAQAVYESFNHGRRPSMVLAQPARELVPLPRDVRARHMLIGWSIVISFVIHVASRRGWWWVSGGMLIAMAAIAAALATSYMDNARFLYGSAMAGAVLAPQAVHETMFAPRASFLGSLRGTQDDQPNSSS